MFCFNNHSVASYSFSFLIRTFSSFLWFKIIHILDLSYPRPKLNRKIYIKGIVSLTLHQDQKSLYIEISHQKLDTRNLSARADNFIRSCSTKPTHKNGSFIISRKPDPHRAKKLIEEMPAKTNKPHRKVAHITTPRAKK